MSDERNAPTTGSGGSSAALIYEYRASEDRNGWWFVAWRYSSGGSWQVVARVFGERRAEIVRDALSKEANEVV